MYMQWPKKDRSSTALCCSRSKNDIKRVKIVDVCVRATVRADSDLAFAADMEIAIELGIKTC